MTHPPRAHILAILVLATSLFAGCAEEAEAPLADEPASAREDTTTFDIPPGQAIEYKLRVAKGADVTYSWSAQRPLSYDFHGDTGASGYASHKKGMAVADQDEWSAPFSGNHGWYWKNVDSQTVRVTLTTAGDYTIIGLV